MVVEIVSVAHFKGEAQVVDAGGEVGKFQSGAEGNAVFEEIVACTAAHREALGIAGMAIDAERAVEHEFVDDEVAGIGIEAELEVGVFAVTHVQPRERSAHVVSVLFELCAGGGGHGQEQEECGENFLHKRKSGRVPTKKKMKVS